MNLIEGVVIRLLRDKHIFYASLLGQMKRIEVPNQADLRTCGVGVQGGRIYLYWNAAFLESLTDKERIAVLIHECLHLVFYHPFRRKDREPMLFNIAGDIAINQMIQDLPKSALLPATFGKLNLPPNAAAEVYYKLLQSEKSKYKIQKNADGSITITRPDGTTVTIEPIDSHDNWNGENGEGDTEIDSLDAEVIKQAVKESWEQAQGRGNLPSSVVQAIEEILTPPTIPWAQQLKQYIGNKVKGNNKYTWKRLNRRFDIEDFKGKTRTRILKLVIAIDTSGSVGVPEFQEFISELKGIQQAYKSDFTVIEADAEVQKVYNLSKHSSVDTKFKGRGGTAFEPVFDYIALHRLGPDVVIYFTDLMGSFPKPPMYSTLWVQTGSATIAPPFGTVLRIEGNKKKKDAY